MKPVTQNDLDKAKMEVLLGGGFVEKETLRMLKTRYKIEKQIKKEVQI